MEPFAKSITLAEASGLGEEDRWALDQSLEWAKREPYFYPFEDSIAALAAAIALETPDSALADGIVDRVLALPAERLTLVSRFADQFAFHAVDRTGVCEVGEVARRWKRFALLAATVLADRSDESEDEASDGRRRHLPKLEKVRLEVLGLNLTVPGDMSKENAPLLSALLGPLHAWVEEHARWGGDFAALARVFVEPAGVRHREEVLNWIAEHPNAIESHTWRFQPHRPSVLRLIEACVQDEAKLRRGGSLRRDALRLLSALAGAGDEEAAALRQSITPCLS